MAFAGLIRPFLLTTRRRANPPERKDAPTKRIFVAMPDGGRAEARLHPGCYRKFANGRGKGTAVLLNGHLIRVSRLPARAAWRFAQLVTEYE